MKKGRLQIALVDLAFHFVLFFPPEADPPFCGFYIVAEFQTFLFLLELIQLYV